MHTQIGDRAVVLGASLAGLLTARVLTDAYGQVTLIDRDQLPETAMHRRGVPHARHIHALAARGQQVLEELFPGLTAELVAHGCRPGTCWPTHACTWVATGFDRRTPEWCSCAPAGHCWRAAYGPGYGRSPT